MARFTSLSVADNLPARRRSLPPPETMAFRAVTNFYSRSVRTGQGPPPPPGQLKFTVSDTCDRIKEEFNFLQAQYHRRVPRHWPRRGPGAAAPIERPVARATADESPLEPPSGRAARFARRRRPVANQIGAVVPPRRRPVTKQKPRSVKRCVTPGSDGGRAATLCPLGD